MKSGDRAAVARAPAPGSPKQIGVAVVVGTDQFTVGSDDIDRGDLLGRPSPPAEVPPDAACSRNPPTPTEEQLPLGKKTPNCSR
jgi:hypothetical protein